MGSTGMQTGKNRLLIPIVAMSLAGGVLSCSVPHSASATSGTAATPDVAAPTSSPTSIAWQSWSGDLFARAKHEHKFVLLDLEAVWCHWCHVEDDITYRDPQVIALINSKYIAVKVDQDSRPDISNRYEDYGWPATIVFNADAGEIVKRRGYLPPKEMASMLQAIIDDPTPGPSVEPATQIAYGNSDSLGNDLQNELEDKLSAAMTRNSAAGDIFTNTSTGTRWNLKCRASAPATQKPAVEQSRR
jgi:hypothetical protein